MKAAKEVVTGVEGAIEAVRAVHREADARALVAEVVPCANAVVIALDVVEGMETPFLWLALIIGAEVVVIAVNWRIDAGALHTLVSGTQIAVIAWGQSVAATWEVLVDAARHGVADVVGAVVAVVTICAPFALWNIDGLSE